MSLCISHSAITGEAEDGGEGETLLGLRQTVVEGVPGDTPVSPIQNGEDLCTGSSTFTCFNHFTNNGIL